MQIETTQAQYRMQQPSCLHFTVQKFSQLNKSALVVQSKCETDRRSRQKTHRDTWKKNGEKEPENRTNTLIGKC